MTGGGWSQLAAGRAGAAALRGWWVEIAAVAIRLVVAALLIVGPWVDEPPELGGWDVARFQELADAPGVPYQDFEAEYPPGMLGLVELVAGRDVVDTHRTLASLLVGVDLALAALLLVHGGRTALRAYLVLSLLLLPGLYQRFDLVAALAAVAGLVVLSRGRPLAGAAAVTAGFGVKTWPVVAAAGWVTGARPRLGFAAVTAAGVCLAVSLWVAWVGPSGPEQVLTFRGATAWQVESTPGLLTALLTDAEMGVESGAFRLGEAHPLARAALVGVAAAGGVAVLVRRYRTSEPLPGGDAFGSLALVGLLLVTAPLFSPQFMIWLLPWAALGWATPRRTPSLLVACATVITFGVFAIWSPPEVDATAAVLALLLRNGLVAAAALSAYRALATPGVTRSGVATGSTLDGLEPTSRTNTQGATLRTRRSNR